MVTTHTCFHCCHFSSCAIFLLLYVKGGLFSKDGVTLDDIRKIKRNQQPPDEGIMTDLLWYIIYTIFSFAYMHLLFIFLTF